MQIISVGALRCPHLTKCNMDTLGPTTDSIYPGYQGVHFPGQFIQEYRIY